MGTEAGPLEAAGKDVAGVVKSIDGKLAAVGIIAEKVKSQCKGCPSVSAKLYFYLLHKYGPADGNVGQYVRILLVYY